MSLLNHMATLLAVNPAVNTPQTGTTFTIIPVEPGPMMLAAFLDGSQDGGANTPTVTVHIETSHDGTKWVSIANIALNADGSLSDYKDLTKVGPKVRARTALTGGTLPNHTATVKLTADKPFHLF